MNVLGQVPTAVTVVRLGDMLMVGAPEELTAEPGLQVRSVVK